MRTESEKLTQAPIKVILGGKEYEIAPLVIRDSREWRQKVVPLLMPLAREANSFEEVLKEMLVTMPDTVLDLFFEYAKGLNREKIEAITTEAEIVEAFDKVVEAGFPLAQSLPRTMKRLSR